MKRFFVALSTRPGAVAPMVFGLLLVAAPASARQTGTDVQPCEGCHELGEPPTLVIAVDNQQVEPGGTATVRMLVSSDNQVSGFSARAPAGAGQLAIVDELTQREVKPGVISHIAPKAFVNGMATWEFTYTTPPEVGVSVLEVSTVSANGNMEPDDDGAVSTLTWVAHGCEAQAWYPDHDLDGFGDGERTPTPSCEPVPDHVPNGLDCADDDPAIHPDAVELCNAADDNCNGTADEGLNTTVLYPDVDGDGFGVASGVARLDCPPVEGYADNFDDCDDEDPMLNPGMPEICNGADDNCDRRVDNDPVTTCGTGACQVVVMGCDVACIPGEPTPEVCNELDDDCDGAVDNGCMMPAAAGGATGTGGAERPGVGGAPAGAVGGASTDVAAAPGAGKGGCTVAPTRNGTPTGLLALVLAALVGTRRQRGR